MDSYGDAVFDRRFTIGKLNSNLSLDTSFGSGAGYAMTTLPWINSNGTPSDAIMGTLVKQNGKFVGIGSRVKLDNGGAITLYYTAVRYNSDGTVDTTFDSSGSDPGYFQVQDPHPGPLSNSLYGYNRGVVPSNTNGFVDGEDNILIVGGIDQIDMNLVRLTPDGVADGTFSTTGEIDYSFADGSGSYTTAEARAVAVAADGTIYITGGAGAHPWYCDRPRALPTPQKHRRSAYRHRHRRWGGGIGLAG